MKTSLKRWLSWTLVFMMVLSSTGLVFADQNSNQSGGSAGAATGAEVKVESMNFNVFDKNTYKWKLEKEGWLDFYDVPHYRVTVKPDGVETKYVVKGDVVLKNYTDQALTDVVVTATLANGNTLSPIQNQTVSLAAQATQTVSFAFDIARLSEYKEARVSVDADVAYSDDIGIGDSIDVDKEIQVVDDGFTFDPLYVVNDEMGEVSREFELDKITQLTTHRASIDLEEAADLVASVTLDPTIFEETDALFYIRKSNTIVREDGNTQYPNSQYWPSYPGLAGVIKQNRDVYNDLSAVEHNIDTKPTREEFERRVPGYDADDYKAVWYVVKDAIDYGKKKWHVDGILVEINALSIEYRDETAENPEDRFLAKRFYSEYDSAKIGEVSANSVYPSGVVEPEKDGYILIIK